MSRAQQNVLRWAFPFGCPAEPIYFPFGEVLCKGCRSNLRLLRLSLCVLLERGSIDLCKQRGNELRDAPLTALPLFPGYPPAVFVSILSNLGVLMFNLQMEKVNGTTGSVPGELMLLPSEGGSFQVLSTDLTRALFVFECQGRFVVTQVPFASIFLMGSP